MVIWGDEVKENNILLSNWYLYFPSALGIRNSFTRMSPQNISVPKVAWRRSIYVGCSCDYQVWWSVLEKIILFPFPPPSLTTHIDSWKQMANYGRFPGSMPRIKVGGGGQTRQEHYQNKCPIVSDHIWLLYEVNSKLPSSGEWIFLSMVFTLSIMSWISKLCSPNI